uniref:DNA-directed RNA polymerase n=1 Tax=Jakoba libera TaxID=143017 RepID=M4QLA1_JAKLI|nr:RNA polymerase subunit beta' [Jakoba libera]AGH24223.1 RNA polymerase subunit beta' [Jakoba libera]
MKTYLNLWRINREYSSSHGGSEETIKYDSIKTLPLLKSVTRLTFSDDLRQDIIQQVIRVKDYINSQNLSDEQRKSYEFLCQEYIKYDPTKQVEDHFLLTKDYTKKHFPGIAQDLLFLDDSFSTKLNLDDPNLVDEIESNYNTFGLILFPFPIPNSKYAHYFSFFCDEIEKEVVENYIAEISKHPDVNLSIKDYNSSFLSEMSNQEKLIKKSVMLYKKCCLLNLDNEIKKLLKRCSEYFDLLIKYEKELAQIKSQGNNQDEKQVKHVKHINYLMLIYRAYYETCYRKAIFFEKLLAKGLRPTDFFHVGIPVCNLNYRGIEEFTPGMKFAEYLRSLNSKMEYTDPLKEKSRHVKMAETIKRESFIKEMFHQVEGLSTTFKGVELGINEDSENILTWKFQSEKLKNKKEEMIFYETLKKDDRKKNLAGNKIINDASVNSKSFVEKKEENFEKFVGNTVDVKKAQKIISEKSTSTIETNHPDPSKKVMVSPVTKLLDVRITQKKTNVLTYYLNELVEENSLFLQWFGVPLEDYALLEMKLKYLRNLFKTEWSAVLPCEEREKLIKRLVPLHWQFFVDLNDSLEEVCYRAVFFEWYDKVEKAIERSWAEEKVIHGEFHAISQVIGEDDSDSLEKQELINLIRSFMNYSFCLETEKGTYHVPSFSITLKEKLKEMFDTGGKERKKGEEEKGWVQRTPILTTSILSKKLYRLINTYSQTLPFYLKYEQKLKRSSSKLDELLLHFSGPYGIKTSLTVFYVNYLSLANLLGLPMNLTFLPTKILTVEKLQEVPDDIQKKDQENPLFLNTKLIFSSEFPKIVQKNLKGLLSLETDKDGITRTKDNEPLDYVYSCLLFESQSYYKSPAWKRLLQDFWYTFVGKQGRFRGAMYSKRVDYSGRAVISSDPTLKLSECVIPSKVAAILFYPMVVQKLRGYFLKMMDEIAFTTEINKEEMLLSAQRLLSESKEENHLKEVQKDKVQIRKTIAKYSEKLHRLIDLSEEMYDLILNQKGVVKLPYKYKELMYFFLYHLDEKGEIGKEIKNVVEEWKIKEETQIQNHLVEKLLQHMRKGFLSDLTKQCHLLNLLERLSEAKEEINFFQDLLSTQEFYSYFNKLISKFYILLTRQPSLHRLSIQAFKPKLGSESAVIRLNPLVCPPFNADFDGDTMSISLLHTLEAQLEASVIMGNHNNLLTPGTSKVIISPTLDLLFGLYYLTQEKEDQNTPLYELQSTKDFYLVEKDLQAKKCTIWSCMKYQGQKTTVGRFLIYYLITQHFHLDFSIINCHFDKKKISILLGNIIQNYDTSCAGAVLDILHSLGSFWAYQSGLTVNFNDFIIPASKINLSKKLQDGIIRLRNSACQGLLSKDECHNMEDNLQDSMIAKVMKQLTEDVHYKSETRPGAYMLIDSGSRGSMNQLKQLCGIKGFVMGATGSIIPKPIMGNLREGLSQEEFYLSSIGGRKGIIDRALNTEHTGHLYRQLHYALKELSITGEDCGNHVGYPVGHCDEGLGEKSFLLDPKRFDHIAGRVLASDVYDPQDGSLLALRNDIITRPFIELFYQRHISSLFIRSPMTCGMPHGICQKCYGSDPTDLNHSKLIEKGYPIGVIAAQSMGEPATQLTMRTFHQGGSVEKKSTSSNNSFGTFSEVQGIVMYKDIFLEELDNDPSFENCGLQAIGRNMSYFSSIWIVDLLGQILQTSVIPYGADLFVEDGQFVEINTLLCDDSPSHKPIRVFATYSFIVLSITHFQEKENFMNPLLAGVISIKVPYICHQKGDLQFKISYITFLQGDQLFITEGDFITVGDMILQASCTNEKREQLITGYKRITSILACRNSVYKLPLAYFDGYISFTSYDFSHLTMELTSDVFCISSEDFLHFERMLETRDIQITKVDSPYERDNLSESYREESENSILCFLNKKFLIPNYEVPYLKVRHGSYVEEGWCMTESLDTIYLQDLIHFYGLEGAWESIGKQILSIYQESGVFFNQVHMECLVRQLTHIQVVDESMVSHLVDQDEGLLPAKGDKAKVRRMTMQSFLRLGISQLCRGEKSVFENSYTGMISLHDRIILHPAFFSAVSYDLFRYRMAKYITSGRFADTMKSLYNPDGNMFTGFPVAMGSSLLEKMEQQLPPDQLELDLKEALKSQSSIQENAKEKEKKKRNDQVDDQIDDKVDDKVGDKVDEK